MSYIVGIVNYFLAHIVFYIDNIASHKTLGINSKYLLRACSYGESFPGIFPFHLENRSAEVIFFHLSYEKSFRGKPG